MFAIRIDPVRGSKGTEIMTDITSSIMSLARSIEYIWNSDFVKLSASRKLSIDNDRSDMESALFNMFVLGNAGVQPIGGEYGKKPFSNILVKYKAEIPQDRNPIVIKRSDDGGRHFSEVPQGAVRHKQFNFLRLFSWENYDYVKFEYVHVVESATESVLGFRELLLPISCCMVIAEQPKIGA